MNALAARPYISPRTRALSADEQETRRLAYAIKSVACDSRDFDAAGLEMARLIPGGPCWLVPIPDRNGNTDANAKLAAAIARYTPGAQLAAVIRRTAPVESQCDRHKHKLGPSPISDHKFTRTSRWLTARPTFLVDNVTTSGHTLQAAHNALGFGTGLVFADANCRQNRNPQQPALL